MNMENEQGRTSENINLGASESAVGVNGAGGVVGANSAEGVAIPQAAQPQQKVEKKGLGSLPVIMLLAVLLLGACGYIVWDLAFRGHDTQAECPGIMKDCVVGDKDEAGDDSGDADADVAPVDGADVAKLSYKIRNMNEESDSLYVFPTAGSNIVNVRPVGEYGFGVENPTGVDNHSRFDVDLSGEPYRELIPESLRASWPESVTGEVDLGKDVRGVYAMGMGQAPGYEFVLFIMMDGTAKYIPICASLRSGKVILKDLDVENVVSVAISEVDGVTPLLMRLDGGYYSSYDLLYEELEETWKEMARAAGRG